MVVSPSPPVWTAAMALRMRRHFVLKVAGVSAFTWVFFVAYLYLLHHPVYAVTVMPLTALDRLIPFQPEALVAYLSLWLYVGAAPGLLLTLRELLAYGLWIGAMCLTGLALFLVWPTAVPKLAVDVSDSALFTVLQSVDAAGNACPSMHVAAAMFSAIWVDHLLRLAGVPAWLRLANAAWFAAIAWSTLATKQHVVIDVVAGALLGIAFAWPALRWMAGGGRLERHAASPPEPLNTPPGGSIERPGPAR